MSPLRSRSSSTAAARVARIVADVDDDLGAGDESRTASAVEDRRDLGGRCCSDVEQRDRLAPRGDLLHGVALEEPDSIIEKTETCERITHPVDVRRHRRQTFTLEGRSERVAGTRPKAIDDPHPTTSQLVCVEIAPQKDSDTTAAGVDLDQVTVDRAGSQFVETVLDGIEPGSTDGGVGEERPDRRVVGPSGTVALCVEAQVGGGVVAHRVPHPLDLRRTSDVETVEQVLDAGLVFETERAEQRALQQIELSRPCSDQSFVNIHAVVSPVWPFVRSSGVRESGNLPLRQARERACSHNIASDLALRNRHHHVAHRCGTFTGNRIRNPWSAADVGRLEVDGRREEDVSVDYVMVPVPEEHRDDVERFLTWGLAMRKMPELDGRGAPMSSGAWIRTLVRC